jgi:hypothetical protein
VNQQLDALLPKLKAGECVPVWDAAAEWDLDASQVLRYAKKRQCITQVKFPGKRVRESVIVRPDSLQPATPASNAKATQNTKRR